jgi:hypothetical protein
MDMASTWTDTSDTTLFRRRTIRFIFVSYAAIAPLFLSDRGLVLVLVTYCWLMSCGILIEETRNAVSRS